MPRPKCHRRFADAFEQAGLPADLASLAADFVVGKESRPELAEGVLCLSEIRFRAVHPCGSSGCDCLPMHLEMFLCLLPANQRTWKRVAAAEEHMRMWLLNVDEGRLRVLFDSVLRTLFCDSHECVWCRKALTRAAAQRLTALLTPRGQ